MVTNLLKYMKIKKLFDILIMQHKCWWLHTGLPNRGRDFDYPMLLNYIGWFHRWLYGRNLELRVRAFKSHSPDVQFQ